MRAFQRINESYHGIVNDPKKLVRYGILFICSIIMVVQLTECFTKLTYPPITTHSHFELNKTIAYPAVTFCRDPPYKEETMNYYNLTTHPKMTSHWREFDYSQHSLSDMFKNMTYDRQETLVLFALDGNPENTKVVSHIFLNFGHCHTIVPLVTTEGTWKHHGYSIMLQHDRDGTELAYDGTPNGWHVFIHEPSENFTEFNMQTSGRGEYMFVRVYEEIEIKLNAQHFNRLPTRENHCSMRPDYSFIECAEMCQWAKLTRLVGCTVPWMSSIDGPECNNYTQMRDMLVEFGKLNENNVTECNCPEPCQMVIFSANVMSRCKFDMYFPSAQVWLYYASKMITVFEERPSYDLNQFVSDLGGSLGFLLGLSVLGVIGVLEKITSILMKRCSEHKEDEGNDSNEKDAQEHESNQNSVSTIDIQQHSTLK